MCLHNADVNECDHQPAPCGQQCNNTDGSFICSCDSGYYLGDDMLTCYGEPVYMHNIFSIIAFWIIVYSNV